MNVRGIEDPHAQRVAAVLEEMLLRTRAGRMPSLLFIAEEIGQASPRYGIVGRFRADPARAIGHLAIMKEKVTDFASSQLPDLDPD
jgi:hypothetical protein